MSLSHCELRNIMITSTVSLQHCLLYTMSSTHNLVVSSPVMRCCILVPNMFICTFLLSAHVSPIFRRCTSTCITYLQNSRHHPNTSYNILQYCISVYNIFPPPICKSFVFGAFYSNAITSLLYGGPIVRPFAAKKCRQSPRPPDPDGFGGSDRQIPKPAQGCNQGYIQTGGGVVDKLFYFEVGIFYLLLLCLHRTSVRHRAYTHVLL